MREDQVVCSKCKGKGSFWSGKLQDGAVTCSKCNGHGILDWIENIMGKSFPNFDMFSADPDGAVDLYYEGNKLIETTKDGIKFYQGV